MRDAEIALVDRLSNILAGNLPISEGEKFISPDVFMHMNHYECEGIEVWRAWLHFIRSRTRVSDLNVTEKRIVVEGDRVRLLGKWIGTVRGKRVVSPEGTAVYRIVDGKIVEIWTLGTNYVIMFGNMVGTPLGLAAVLGYFMLWRRIYYPLVDWSKRLIVRGLTPETAGTAPE